MLQNCNSFGFPDTEDGLLSFSGLSGSEEPSLDASRNQEWFTNQRLASASQPVRQQQYQQQPSGFFRYTEFDHTIGTTLLAANSARMAALQYLAIASNRRVPGISDCV